MHVIGLTQGARYLGDEGDHVENDESTQECNQAAQDLPEALAAFWGNQLEQIRKRAERQAARTGARTSEVLVQLKWRS